jgi:predicted lipoprotein with Yx(FWY)xxD motif
MTLPDGIGVHEIGDAAGAGLVDAAGATLYTSRSGAPAGPACAAPDCARHWMPLEAPAIAGAMGDFLPLTRIDGVTQWTYRGKPLYTFDGDHNPGEANGVDSGADMSVALVARFFMPPDVTLHRTVELGTLLATRSGAVLYQRDRVATGAELHPFRADHGSPALGRSLGTSSCDARCAQAWPPLLAPANALPSGFWDVLVRRGGTRQWAYKGFALYTYAADEPGDFKGNAIYDLDPIGNATTRADPPVPVTAAGIGLGAMFWHAVVP